MSVASRSSKSEITPWLERCQSKEAQEFFKKGVIHKKRSTFGTIEKVAPKPVSDDGYSFAFKATEWKYSRDNGSVGSRPRVIKNLGSLQRPPGPGQYDDKDELRSKMEAAPAFSLASRHTEVNFDMSDVPGPGAYHLKDGVEPYLLENVKPSGSPSKGTSIPKLASPGPGAYDPTNDLNLYKYVNKNPICRMPPQQQGHSPTRKTIDTRTTLVKEKYQTVDTLGPLMYDTSNDPRDVRKVRAVSIGERRERISGVPAQEPDYPPGPGTYDSLDFGYENPESLPLSKELLSKGSQHSNIMQRHGQTGAQFRIKKKINQTYKSDYCFPKKPPPTARHVHSGGKTSLW